MLRKMVLLVQLLLVQLVLYVTTSGQMLAEQGIMSLNSLCRFPRNVVNVKDAIMLLADTSNPFQALNRSSADSLTAGASCKVTVDAVDEDVAGFLVNVENNLPTHREHCTSWNTLFRLRSHKQSLSFGCAHHSTQYFARPMRISFLPVALRQLVIAYHERQHEFALDAFTVTITTVTYGCNRDRKLMSKWKPCAQVDICIPAQLICDGVNNCGLSEDERNCVNNKAATKGATRSWTTVATTPISRENLIPTLADVQNYVEVKHDASNSVIPTSSASVAMVMGFFLLNGFCIAFFLFLGLCSIGCCCSSCLYRAQNEKSRRTFVGYFRKFGSFGNAKRDPSSAQPAETAPLRKASATSSISTENARIVMSHSPPPPPPPYIVSHPLKRRPSLLFGLNLGNERHMKECEPEVEDGGDDHGMHFLSSMLRQHHSRTNNMLASALLPMPFTAIQPPNVKPIKKRSNFTLLPTLAKLTRKRRPQMKDDFCEVRANSGADTDADCNV